MVVLLKLFASHWMKVSAAKLTELTKRDISQYVNSAGSVTVSTSVCRSSSNTTSLRHMVFHATPRA